MEGKKCALAEEGSLPKPTLRKAVKVEQDLEAAALGSQLQRIPQQHYTGNDRFQVVDLCGDNSDSSNSSEDQLAGHDAPKPAKGDKLPASTLVTRKKTKRVGKAAKRVAWDESEKQSAMRTIEREWGPAIVKSAFVDKMAKYHHSSRLR